MADQFGTTLSLEIAALDRAPVRLDVLDVSLPGTAGVFTVLPGHAPMVATIELGVLTATMPDGVRHSFAVSGGMVHVIQNRVHVLTQTAEMDVEIDLERAQAARERAERDIDRQQGTADVAMAEVALKRAITRIRARGGAGAGALR